MGWPAIEMSVQAGITIPDTGMGLCGHAGLQLLPRCLFHNGNNLPLTGRDVTGGQAAYSCLEEIILETSGKKKPLCEYTS